MPTAKSSMHSNGMPVVKSWPRDLAASVVVFLISLPLCIGIAVASGVDPVAGLISGIIGGIVVGWLGGSPLQVSGPAAGLVVLVWEFVQHHSLAALGAALLIAGSLQIMAGLLRLGRWFRAVSPSVIEGMLAAIGLSIIGSQFHVMMGETPQSGTMANLAAIPVAFGNCLSTENSSSHLQAMTIGAVTLLAMLGWKRFAPGRLRLVPQPLVGVVAGAALAYCTQASVHFISIPAHFVQALHSPGPDLWGHLIDPSVISMGIGIALIASAESLLSAASIDKLHSGGRTNFDRELAAQGVGNFLSGLCGGLPVTGVIVRSAANVEAGAKTRVSAVAHGFWILCVVTLVPALLGLLPTAALAAVLVYCGCKLIDLRAVAALWNHGRGEVLVYGVTLIGIVCSDLLTGVAMGLILAAIRVLYLLSHFEAHFSTSGGCGQEVLRLTGAATFVRLPQLATVLERLPCDRQLHLDLAGLHFVDQACQQLLSDWERQQITAGRNVIVDRR